MSKDVPPGSENAFGGSTDTLGKLGVCVQEGTGAYAVRTRRAQFRVVDQASSVKDTRITGSEDVSLGA